METIIGLECKLFHNSGTYGSPVWAECGSVKDLDTDTSHNEVDASRRGSGGIRVTELTLTDHTVNVTFVKDKSDATFSAIETAAKAKASMELAVLDGPNAIGTDWFTAKWKASSWQEGQALEDVVEIQAVFRVVADDDLEYTEGTGVLPTTRP